MTNLQEVVEEEEEQGGAERGWRVAEVPLASGGRSGTRSPSSSPPPCARHRDELDDPVLYPRDLDDFPADSSREGRILFARAFVDDASLATTWWRRALQLLICLGAMLLLLSMACSSRRAYCSRPSLPPREQESLTCSDLGLVEQGCAQVHGVRQLCAGALHSAGVLLGSAVGVDASAEAQPGRELTGQEVSRAELRTEILELRRQFDSDLQAAKQTMLEECTMAAAHQRSEDAASRVVLTDRMQAIELEQKGLKEEVQDKAQADDVAAQLATKADATSMQKLVEALADKPDTAVVNALLAEHAKATASDMEALSATVAAKADMAAVTTLLADKADAAELAGVSSSSSDTVEAHSGRLASLEAEVAETKSQLANGVSRQEYSSLSAVVSETKEGLSKAERSIDDVRETLVASQDVLRQEHGAALAALEASDTAQQAQADDVAALVEAQAALQLRVTELQTSKDTLQESVITLDEAVEKAKVPVDEMGLRLSAIELKMVDATTETKLRYALSHA